MMARRLAVAVGMEPRTGGKYDHTEQRQIRRQGTRNHGGSSEPARMGR
jgi:hypothetical protein